MYRIALVIFVSEVTPALLTGEQRRELMEFEDALAGAVKLTELGDALAGAVGDVELLTVVRAVAMRTVPVMAGVSVGMLPEEECFDGDQFALELVRVVDECALTFWVSCSATRPRRNAPWSQSLPGTPCLRAMAASRSPEGGACAG